MERNNLYTKVMLILQLIMNRFNVIVMQVVFAGKGPNRTMKLIFKRSILIEVYRSAHRIIENNFYLTHRTLWHSHPKMLATLRKLATYIQDKDPHTFKKGQVVKYEIPDVVNDGFEKMFENTDLYTIRDDAGVRDIHTTGGDIGVR
jgi:hypothetical protein